jgi:hypothetical protein
MSNDMWGMCMKPAIACSYGSIPEVCWMDWGTPQLTSAKIAGSLPGFEQNTFQMQVTCISSVISHTFLLFQLVITLVADDIFMNSDQDDMLENSLLFPSSQCVFICCKAWCNCEHVMWVPITTAWHVLGLQMEMAFRYGGYLQICWISSHSQSARGGPPAGVLGKGLTSCHKKKIACYKILCRV